MWVSCARHATAIGLSRPVTAGVSFTRARARSGTVVVVVDAGFFVAVDVAVVGAGLVGGIGRGDVVLFEDDPLPHAESASAPTAITPTTTRARCTSGRLW